tara:strand:+ start:101 stop:619 length:519 start_codon:yes stop_codon:yes gene_type:complete
MAISKITGNPFTDIQAWIWERTKTIRPNPMKPTYTEMVIDKEIDNNKLQKTLISFKDKINVIIDEVNDLGERVTQNETDISIIEKRLDQIDNTIINIETALRMKAESAAASVKGHIHPPNAGGPVGPSLGRKGGSAKKLQPGGRPRPVTTSMKDLKQKLIVEIKTLQQNNDG